VLKSQDINILLANTAVLNSGQKAIFTDADIESIEWSLLDKVRNLVTPRFRIRVV
jgi:hypothetical protein